jgi:hypothetical protein
VPIPQTKAEGVVTFRNLTEEEVTIPVGTVLTSTGLPGVRFVTVEHGKLEGGLKATVDIPVEAESAGATGNVEAETILAIEGDLGLLVTASNAEPATGGSNRLENAATETDLAYLREDLMEELEEQALEEMEAMLGSGDQIFADTLKVEQVLEEDYAPPLGQPSRKVTLTMQVEFVASYSSSDDLTELASTVLNASQPEGYAARDEPLSFETVSAHRTDNEGVTRWVVRVSRKLEKQVETGKIVPLVQGRDIAVAINRLENNLDISYAPKIQLTPEWWPWMPLIPFNISVETR